MTVLTAADDFAIDTANLDFSGLATGQIQSGTSTALNVTYAGEPGLVDTFYGYGFTYSSAINGQVNGGVFTGVTETVNGKVELAVSGFSVTASQLYSLIANNDSAAIKSAIFSGDDTLLGGASDDRLDGFLGNNVIFGGGGNDVINGSIDGFNRVNGNAGDDTIYGWSRVGDWLLGGQGNDRIDASLSTGHNICNGYKDNDTIFGGSGGDTLRGGMGDDVIIGGIGNDHLFGDRGFNTLTGGQGADTFHNTSAVEYSVSTITDFSQAQGDRIAIDAGLSWTATQESTNVHVVVSNGAEFILQNVSLTSLADGWIGH